MIQSFKMAWSSIISNKMRSFLTMLGIIIGVTSLVVLVSLVNGAVTSVTDEISASGTNKISISINKDKGSPLTLEEVLNMRNEKGVQEIAAVGTEEGTARSELGNGDVTITGTTPGYFQIQKLKLGQGRSMKTADLDSSSYTVVINSYMARKLFKTEAAVGNYVDMNGKRYQVIGVIKKPETEMYGMDVMEAFVPYSTLMRSSETVSYVKNFSVLASNEQSLKQAESSITKLLSERFRNDKKAFRVSNEASFMKLVESTNKTMMLMLGGIAAISLIVGGIGIMNIMLVSVTERTREIGIRKAIGADYANIMIQFLVEALVISLIGCAIGIALSWGIVSMADQMASQYNFKLSMKIIWIAVGFSATIGIAFGSYPADKAARKKPIDALRFS